MQSTGEQFMDLKELRAMFQDIYKNLKELEIQSNKTDEQLKRLMELIEKDHKETDQKFKETDQKLDKLLKSMEYLNSFTLNYSKTLERIFYEILWSQIDEKGEIRIGDYYFDMVFLGSRIGPKKQKKEVDIVLTSSGNRWVAFLEVKSNLHPNDIDQLLKTVKFIHKSKNLKNYEILWGFASPNVPEEIRQKILSEGFFLIEFKPQENWIRLIEPKKLKVYNVNKGNFLIKVLNMLFSF